MDKATQETRTLEKTMIHDHLETWIESFLIDRTAQGLSQKTIEFYRLKLQTFCQFCETQAITQVSQISADVIRRYLMWLQERGNNAGGVHAFYRALRAFFYWYADENDLDQKPAISKVKPPKVDLEPLQPIELDQVQALIKACDKSFTGLRDAAIFLSLLDSGCRAGELLSIDLDDCDLVSGAVLLRKTKNRKPRTVYMSQATRQAIRRYLRARADDCPALFINIDGNRLRFAGLRSIVTRRAKQAGIEAPPLHSFRRAFAINFLRNGGDPFTLQQLLGHSSLEVVRRYLALDQGDLRSAHERNSPVNQLKNRRK